MKTSAQLEAIYENGRDIRKIKFDDKEIRLIDDWGMNGGKWFVIGEEFGPRVIVHSKNEETAYDAFIDEERVVGCDDVHEAYGFYIMGETWYKLDNGPFYLCTDRDDLPDDIVDVRDIPGCNGTRKVCGIFETRQGAREGCLAILIDQAENENHLDLIEGYAQQSNATDSGIVDVSHSLFIWELNDLERLSIRSKA